MAFESYCAELDRLCGPGKRHVSESKLKAHHEVCKEAAMSLFTSKANLGSDTLIEKFQLELTEQILKKYTAALSINADRDPMKNLEMYVFPLQFLFFFYIVSTVETCFVLAENS